MTQSQSITVEMDQSAIRSIVMRHIVKVLRDAGYDTDHITSTAIIGGFPTSVRVNATKPTDVEYS